MTEFPRPDTVSLVACGPSALACGAASAPGMVVAINGAVHHVRYDVALSMDGRFTRNTYRALQGRVCMFRESAWEHAVRAGAKRWSDVNTFANDIGSTKFGGRGADGSWQLNGDNSGYCALNFAYLLRPRRVFLYGFDMGAVEHFFGPYPWANEPGASRTTPEKFGKWRSDMNEASRQFHEARIDVVNTNPQSKVRAFRTGRP